VRSGSAKDLFGREALQAVLAIGLQMGCFQQPTRSRSLSPSGRKARSASEVSQSVDLRGSEGLKQALAYSPDGVGMRRVNSVPPRLNHADETSSLLGSPLGDIPESLLLGSPRSPRQSTARPSVSPSHRRLWSSQSECSLQSALTGIGESSPRSIGQAWRYNGGNLPRSPRLRGAGKVIGARDQGSAGIPWRHLPNYNSSGHISETGDRLQVLVTPRSFSGQKIGQFSPRSMMALGMKELLSPDLEKSPSSAVSTVSTAPSSPAALSAAIVGENAASAREAWLELVKSRSAAKLGRQMLGSHVDRMLYSDDSTTTSAGAISTPTNSEKSPAPGDDRNGLHWGYRQQRKSVTCDLTAKDRPNPFCLDQEGLSRAATPRAPSKNASLVGCLEGPGALIKGHSSSRNRVAAESVADASRNWNFQQAVQSVQSVQSATTTPRNPPASPTGGASPKSCVSRSFSMQSFSSTPRQVDRPVHSVRPKETDRRIWR